MGNRRSTSLCRDRLKLDKYSYEKHNAKHKPIDLQLIICKKRNFKGLCTQTLVVQPQKKGKPKDSNSNQLT
jgi:hypothetical protein